MRQLFISYARENKPAVDDLIRDLDVLGYEAWIDSSLRGGQSWWEEILRRIAECDVFVPIVSRNTLGSVACKRELEWALATKRPVLPVAFERLPEALPRSLSMRQIVDYSHPGKEAAFALAGALATVPAAPAAPEEAPEPPPAPLSYLSDLVEQVGQPEPLTHDEQRQALVQLQPALHSADPEEREGGRYVLEMFSRRGDLYADVDHTLVQWLAETDPAQAPAAIPAWNQFASAPTLPAQPGPVPSTPPPAGFAPWPGPRWQRHIILIAAIVASVITVASVVTLVATKPAHTAAKSEPPLDDVLLSGEELDAVMGQKGMLPVMRFDQLQEDIDEVVPAECHAIAYVAGRKEYAAVSPSAVREDVFVSPGDSTSNVDQAVFRTSSADVARRFVDDSERKWQSCLNKAVTAIPSDGSPQTHDTFRAFLRKDNLISALEDTDDNFKCQRALAFDSNYIADVRACNKEAISSEAEVIALKLLKNATSGRSTS